jgi:Bacterial Ig-like domain (group 3)
MKGTPIIKLKSLSVGRKALLAGVATATVGLAMLGGTAAYAAAPLGNSAGNVAITATSGGTALTTGSTTTAGLWYKTLTGCPAGSQGSGALTAVNSDGVNTTLISPVTNGTASPWVGQLNSTFKQIQTLTGVGAGQTDELVVDCNSQQSLLGNDVFAQDIWVTYSADGSTFTISNTPPSGPANTTVVVTATPNPAQIGSTVTLNATVTANTGSATPAGTVQFQVGGTAVGGAVTLSSAGTASTTTTFTAAGPQSVTAVYTPATGTNFAGSTSAAFTENVTTANPNSTGELITVSVAPSGSFTFSGTTNATAALTESGLTATGTMVPVSVTDTRTGLAPNASVPSLVNGYNGYPGWSVVGQATDFTAPNSHPAGLISASNFNWTPTTPATGDFTLGSASTTGLGTAQTLASAAAGHGNGAFSFGAGLSLTVPASAPAGAYSSTLTLTANPTANFS